MTDGSLAAIVLAGGRATRMGGAVKPLIDLDGRSLIARAVAAAVDAGCAPVVVVGPVLDAALPAVWVREDPPFAGPAAAIAAGAAALPTGIRDALILAGDLAFPEKVVVRLTSAQGRAAADSSDAVVLRAGGHAQWLAGRYRVAALRRAVDARGWDLAGASVRALLEGLAVEWAQDDDGITADIDTPADLERIRAGRRTRQEDP